MSYVPKKKLSAVCMLVTNIDAPSGGVQKHSRLLLEELNRRGIATFACVRNYYSLRPSETANGTVFHRSPVLGKSLAINGLIYLFDTFAWLLRHRKKYDVLHCQQMFGPAMAAAVASFFIRKPIVVRVTTVGALGEVKHIREMPLSGIRLKLIRRVSRWIALTNEMADELKTLNVPSEKIRIIHNSTKIPHAAAFELDSRKVCREKLALKYEKIAVFAGRLSSEKNLDVLIDAWKKVFENYRDAHLLLLGEGGDYRNVETELHEQVNSLGLREQIHFVGHVPNAKDYLLASDVFILPTSTEGMSNALVEAFACGAAIVATDIAANREICEDGVNSLLVPVGDAAAIADAVTKIFDDPAFSESISKAARAKAEDELSIDQMVSAYIDTYKQALADSR